MAANIVFNIIELLDHIAQFIHGDERFIFSLICQNTRTFGCRPSTQCMQYAAIEGNLGLLELFGSLGYKGDECVCKTAIHHNNIRLLKYLYENGHKFICDQQYWPTDTECQEYMISICEYRRIISDVEDDWESLINYKLTTDFLDIHRPHWCHEIAEIAAISGNAEALEYIANSGLSMAGIMESAVYSHSLECVKVLADCGELTQDIYYYAAYENVINIIDYVIDKKVPIPCHAIESAALSGNLDIIIKLHENGGKINKAACYNAMYTNHIHCFEYIIKNLDDIRDNIMEEVATHNLLDFMKIGLELHLPWSYRVYELAIRYDNVECLKFAYENKCPLHFPGTTISQEQHYEVIERFKHLASCCRSELCVAYLESLLNN